MLMTPEIVVTDVQPTAVIRFTVPRSEIQQVMGPGFQELMEVLAAQGIEPIGAWFTHHLRTAPEVFDFELGAPIAAPLVATGRVEASYLPAATVARTIYVGPYEGLGAAWSEFDAWIAEAGYTPDNNLWEHYLLGPEASPDPAAWRTELNRPLIY